MRENKELGAPGATAVAGAGSIAPESASHVAHTPGPWKVYDDGEVWVAPVDADKPIVCSISPHGQEYVYSLEDDANAHLIAAAPELLECARHLRTILRSEAVSYSAPWAEFIAAVDAVIAKAEGSVIENDDR